MASDQRRPRGSSLSSATLPISPVRPRSPPMSASYPRRDSQGRPWGREPGSPPSAMPNCGMRYGCRSSPPCGRTHGSGSTTSGSEPTESRPRSPSSPRCESCCTLSTLWRAIARHFHLGWQGCPHETLAGPDGISAVRRLLGRHVAQVGAVLDRLGPGGVDGLPAAGEDRRPLLLPVGLLHHLVQRLLVGREGRPVLSTAGEEEHRPLAAVDQLVPGARPGLAVVRLLDALVDLLHR